MKPKKTLILSLALAMAFPLFAVMEVSADVQFEGNGTPDSPLQINTAEQLIEFGTRVTSGSTELCAVLNNDLGVGEWTTIGASNALYNGTFDGKGHIITLSKTSSGGNVAMFRTLDYNAVVKNLNLHVTFEGESYIAGVAGTNYGTVSDVTVSGTINARGTGAGGIVAMNRYKNDTNSQRQYGRLYRCINKAAVTGAGSVGGIAGGFFGVMQYCGNEGVVSQTATGSANYAGGLVGSAYSTPQASSPATVSVSDSYNAGTVYSNSVAYTNGSMHMAGLLGGQWKNALSSWPNDNFSVKNCFSYGENCKSNFQSSNSPCECTIKFQKHRHTL